jgi:hypothetical protein
VALVNQATVLINRYMRLKNMLTLKLLGLNYDE